MLPSSNSCHGRLASRNSALLDSTELFFIATLHGPFRKHSLYIGGKACLQRRCIAAEVIRLLLAYSLLRGICLHTRCLKTSVDSDFASPAFGRHVTILSCILVTQIIRNPAIEFCYDRNKASNLK
jgi:hypothetical protein